MCLAVRPEFGIQEEHCIMAEALLSEQYELQIVAYHTLLIALGQTPCMEHHSQMLSR